MWTFAVIFLVPVAFSYALPGFIIPREVTSSETRVVGGEDAPDGAIPYQVSLRSYGSHFCGGSILSKRWVLTAAHCTVNSSPRAIRVVVGTNSLRFGGDQFEVDKIIVHKDYDGNAIKNDVSLIHVNKDIKFSKKIQAIELPDADTAGGAEVLLTGWGRTSYPGSLPNNLQMIKLKALSVRDCQNRIDSINEVAGTEICTLTKSGEGACHGDSGGPLVEGNHVVGVVSWGMPCARGFPDVYSRVFSFKDWILDNMKE